MESKKERGSESRKKKKKEKEQEKIWNGFSKKKKKWLSACTKVKFCTRKIWLKNAFSWENSAVKELISVQ